VARNIGGINKSGILVHEILGMPQNQPAKIAGLSVKPEKAAFSAF
jgi:hypothetical protein